jgi:hypothetical protein
MSYKSSVSESLPASKPHSFITRTFRQYALYRACSSLIFLTFRGENVRLPNPDLQASLHDEMQVRLFDGDCIDFNSSHKGLGSSISKQGDATAVGEYFNAFPVPKRRTPLINAQKKPPW